MSTAILVASFACFLLDSVCFRHFSFNGIPKGGDHHYSQWFPVIHYGSLSCLQAFNISLMQPLMLASGKDQALRA